MPSQPTPFSIRIDPAQLDRLQRRLADYPWPQLPSGAGWPQGAEPDTMKFLVERWTSGFDWPQQEAALNEEPQFTAETDGGRLHFVHHRVADARTTIVLLHGWPSSYLEYLPTARALAQAGFDTVVVSLPGCGFSGVPSTFRGPRAMAQQVHQLLTESLGKTRYVAHGSDWGSLIAGWLGHDFPEACAGVHMTMVSPRFVAGAATAPEEQQWLAGFRERFEDDGAYFRLQTSRPLTASFALHDSPVGWLAWTAEKFGAWGDPATGDRSTLFRQPAQADALLRNASLYLLTGTVASSTWIYRGLTQEGPPGYPGGKRVEVPVAIAATRDPVFVPPPRSLVEKAYNVTRWTPFERGGHFPALDAPDLLQADLEAFAGGLA
jgi:pimeloyl-ACP methyl ester carboxylesterase